MKIIKGDSMEKIFAIVKPSTTFTPGAAALGDMFVDLYHYFKYPSFGGFSLGHDALFFDTFDDAKNYLLPPERRSDWSWLQRYMREDGIIELEVDDTTVRNISAVHRFSGLRDTYQKIDANSFESVKSPNWYCDRVDADKISSEVLQTLSDMLKIRYVKPHSVDAQSDHPKAQLCRQLSARFNQVNGEPEKIKNLHVSEVLALMGGSITVALSLLGMLAPETRPFAVVSLLLGALMTNKSLSRVSDYQNQESAKREYIRNNLFASEASNNRCDHADERRVNSRKL